MCLDVVNWFKEQGCYVMGGVPTHWRRGVEDSRPGYLGVYHSFDMISPWMVGRIADIADADNFYANVNTPDQAECDAHGIDYQPCVLPGDLQSGHRAHGDFMWRQFYNMKRIGVQGIYVSMFDEYNEGNQIAKTAEKADQVPVGSGIRALDEDGTACSSDYYLRLTGDGGRLLKGSWRSPPSAPPRPPPAAPSTRHRPVTSRCASRSRPPATPSTTGRATRSTATRTATGRAPTRPCPSRSRSTWARCGRSPGWCSPSRRSPPGKPAPRRSR